MVLSPRAYCLEFVVAYSFGHEDLACGDARRARGLFDLGFDDADGDDDGSDDAPPGDHARSASRPTRARSARATGDLTIATERGLIHGARAGTATRFLGVPFGAPPTGPRRFAPPAIPACWTDVREATAYAPMCPQRDVVSGNVVGNEDCLYLNVWTPTAALSDGRPRRCCSGSMAAPT